MPSSPLIRSERERELEVGRGGGGGGRKISILPQLGLSLDYYTHFPLSY